MVQDFKQAFIEFALQQQVLRFGEFTLKSGRVSPYFFNAGLFNSGAVLARLGEFYAAAIEQANLEYDVLLGPAYKGIPLAVTTAVALANQHQKDVPYVFNRKEVKVHGEGGRLVGAPMKGRVLIVDDVITAGTAVREVMALIAENNASPAGVVIAFNRQEKGKGEWSAIQEVERDFAVPVISIINLDDLVLYLQGQADKAGVLDQVQRYRDRYGVTG